ncbi:MAG: hypothetical protein ACOYXT_18105 [Bacteroidota bacterium]
MINEFHKLNEQEIELMLKLPILVCILIAGADGNIDKKEIREAIAFVQKNKKSKLETYFREVALDFEDKVKITIQGYPYESTQRNPLVIHELSEVNNVWSKLDRNFAKAIYDAMKEVATRIASSSGGLLGIRSVGSQEAKYLELPMISDPLKN